jgi:hypothetical protein
MAKGTLSTPGRSLKFLYRRMLVVLSLMAYSLLLLAQTKSRAEPKALLFKRSAV